MKNFLFNRTDIKYTFRMLAKNPGFTLLSIIVLAGGLGISIFTFTLSYAVTYKPIPLDNAESIVKICTGTDRTGCAGFKAFEFSELRQELENLENVGIYSLERLYVETENVVTNVFATHTEWNMFQLSNTAAVLGRTLQAYDQLPDAEPVAVIAHGLWQLIANGDGNVINSIVEIEGVATKIVGVLPEGYSFPSMSQLWLPISNSLIEPIENELEFVSAYGNLTSTASYKTASDEVNGLMGRVRQLYPPDPSRNYRSAREQRLDQVDTAYVTTVPMGEFDGGMGLLAIGFLNLLAILIFLLACINVGTLLLARANDRLKDVSIRVALGAPRVRLLVQTMGESIAISALGGVIAVFLAGAGLEFINFIILSFIGQPPFWMVFELDASTLLAVLLFVGLTLLLTSAIPCWRIINGDFNAVMRDGTRGAVGVQSGRVSRSLVVIAIVFITLLLYVGTLITSSLLDLKQSAANVDGDKLLGVDITLDANRYSEPEQLQFFNSLNNALLQNSAIDDALIYTERGVVNLESDSVGTGVEDDYANASLVTASGSLNTIGASLIEGQLLSEFDTPSNPTVVISRSLAEQLWPGQSAIDQRLRFAQQQPGSASPWRRVVGIVSDKVFSGEVSFQQRVNAVYIPLQITAGESVSISAKYTNDPNAAASIIALSINAQDSSLVFNVRNWEEQLAVMDKAANFYLSLTISCGLFSFLIAVTGIYGITKNFIDHQTQEIGTRRALGATDGRISRSFIMKGSRQVITGVIIALLVASPITYLYNSVSGSSVTGVALLGLLIVIATIFATVLFAIVFPIREILKLEPVEALRHQ